MRIQLTFLVPVFVLGGVGVFAQVARGPDPSVRAQVAATASLPALAAETPAYTYVGSSKCKKCHITVSKSWKKTRMGKAFETLKPGVAAEDTEAENSCPSLTYASSLLIGATPFISSISSNDPLKMWTGPAPIIRGPIPKDLQQMKAEYPAFALSVDSNSMLPGSVALIIIPIFRSLRCYRP